MKTDQAHKENLTQCFVRCFCWLFSRNEVTRVTRVSRVTIWNKNSAPPPAGLWWLHLSESKDLERCPLAKRDRWAGLRRCWCCGEWGQFQTMWECIRGGSIDHGRPNNSWMVYDGKLNGNDEWGIHIENTSSPVLAQMKMMRCDYVEPLAPSIHSAVTCCDTRRHDIHNVHNRGCQVQYILHRCYRGLLPSSKGIGGGWI